MNYKNGFPLVEGRIISVDLLRELYDYNYWARDRQLEACSGLSDEQLLRPLGNSHSSLRDTLAHLVGVEWIWHERFCGRSPRSLPSWWEALTTVSSIRERWQGIEAEMRNYVKNLTGDALIQPLTYVNLQGKQWTYPLWQTLIHLVNHQTYHRGQVTTLLRQLGAMPPAIDFLVYYDARVGKAK